MEHGQVHGMVSPLPLGGTEKTCVAGEYFSSGSGRIIGHLTLVER